MENYVGGTAGFWTAWVVDTWWRRQCSYTHRKQCVSIFKMWHNATVLLVLCATPLTLTLGNTFWALHIKASENASTLELNQNIASIKTLQPLTSIEMRHSHLKHMLTKIRVVSLVKKELVSHTLNDDIPGVHWACAAHQSCQDGISGKHIALGFCQLWMSFSEQSKLALPLTTEIKTHIRLSGTSSDNWSDCVWVCFGVPCGSQGHQWW